MSCEDYYNLQSQDGVNVCISHAAARQSTVLTDIGDNEVIKAGEGDEAGLIPLSNVDGETLQLVVEWCEKHKHDRKPSRDIIEWRRQIVVPSWDAQMLSCLDGKQLFKLICAANYLGIPTLLEYSCKHVSNQMKGKNPEELRRLCQIPTDEEDAAAAAAAAARSS